MKPNGKNRKSPSVERQLALSLLRLIECAGAVEVTDDKQEALADLGVAIKSSIAVLDANGYADMESIPTRVKRIEAAIAEALKVQDGAKLAQLGAALDRAKAGKPPLTAEKKTPSTPKTRKPRKQKETGPTEDAEAPADDEQEWLTRHPEPKG